jgi:hypothetical protein
MLRDAQSVLKEIVIGLFWPIDASLNWIIRGLSAWLPNNLFKTLELLAIVIGVAAFLFELRVRDEERSVQAEERLVRMWNLATEPRPGNSGKIPALEWLVAQGKPLNGLQIPDAYLSSINLWGASLENADLGGTNLSHATLSVAYLGGANLAGATLFNAKLNGADLAGTNFVTTRTGVRRPAFGLEQSQIDKACVSKGGKLPLLPHGIEPPTKVCPDGFGTDEGVGAGNTDPN